MEIEKVNDIEPRYYRNRMGENRFRSFVVGYKDSDLWIGIDPESFRPQIPEFAKSKLVELRKKLEDYIFLHPEFASSLAPINLMKPAPKIARIMGDAVQKAGTGPMAAVAGAFSEYLGNAIQNKFDIKEIAVENGGDIYLSLENDLVLSINAGNSPLSGKIGIEIPAKATPLGICTSAGTVGPSTSFGKADAVMVASKNTAMADAFATAIGNRIQQASDIDTQLKTSEQYPEIISILIICKEAVGIRGQFELKLIAGNE